MKTLLLLRHAKSSWKEAGASDHDRRLNERGKRDAPLVGEHLREAALVPDRIVSSTARRACKTAEKVAAACGYEGEIQLDASLYAAAPDDCRAILRRLPPHVERALLVGHNPCFEEFLAELTGLDEHLATATVARISLDVAAWEDLRADTPGKLVALWRPPRDP